MRFTIPGEPIGAPPGPRGELYVIYRGEPVSFARPGRHGKRAYTPKKVRIYRDALTLVLKQNGHRFGAATVGVRVRFYRSNRQRIDIDNLLKNILDAATAAQLWEDDSQVREIDAKLRLGSDDPRVEIAVHEVEDDLVVRPCAACGADLPRDYPSSRRKYCSQKCARSVTRTDRICAECRKPFIIAQSKAKRGRMFCSRECALERHGKTNYRSKNRCADCGEFTANSKAKRCRPCWIKSRKPKSNYWHGREVEVEALPLKEDADNAESGS